jgi:ketosteroid isomerase-like protein
MFCALALLSLPAVVNAADQMKPDDLYVRFAEAHAALDSRALHPLYAPGATYLPRTGRFDIQTRDEILEREKTSHAAMRTNGGSIRLSFRITDRRHFGDLVVDNGYMRSVVRRTKDEPALAVTSKFILVMARQPDGRWALVSDADSDAPAEAYDGASHHRTLECALCGSPVLSGPE